MIAPSHRSRTLVRLALSALLALEGSGCALLRGGKKDNLTPRATAVADPNGFTPSDSHRPLRIPVEGRIGAVKLVGRGGRFVLVETSSGGMLNLPDGQELHCRTSGEPGAARTATLRLSRERRQQFVTADVAEGTPHAGDAVFVGGPDTITPTETHIAPTLLPPFAGGILPPPQGAGR